MPREWTNALQEDWKSILTVGANTTVPRDDTDTTITNTTMDTATSHVRLFPSPAATTTTMATTTSHHLVVISFGWWHLEPAGTVTDFFAYHYRQQFCCSYNGYRSNFCWMTSRCCRIWPPMSPMSSPAKLSLIYEERVREAEYTRDYTFGSLQSSKEPIAMVTREGNNAKFSNFCHRIVKSLITADALNIIRQNMRICNDELI